MATDCPICGRPELEPQHGEFRFEPPATIPGGVMVVPDADWLECSACGNRILNHALNRAIELMRYDRLGLLRPEEIRNIRTRLGVTQVEMAGLLGVGGKTYTRWESGTSYHNKSSDNLIRLFAQNPEMFARLDGQSDPERRQRIAEYVRGLREVKGRSPLGMAAHGADLDAGSATALRRTLQQVIEGRKQR